MRERRYSLERIVTQIHKQTIIYKKKNKSVNEAAVTFNKNRFAVIII